MKNLKLFLGALGTSISLVGCGTGNIQTYPENLRLEIETMNEEKYTLSYEIESERRELKELEKETDSLANQVASLEAVKESLEKDNKNCTPITCPISNEFSENGCYYLGGTANLSSRSIPLYRIEK